MAIDTYRSELKRRTRKGRSIKTGPFAMALIVQGILLAVTVYVVVFVPSMEEDPVFSTKKTIYLPQRELKHRTAVSDFQQAASKPVMLDRLTTSALLPQDMPMMPQLPNMDISLAEEHNAIIEAEALFGQSGLLGALNGLETQSSAISILGIEDEAERFVIAVDISQSVVNSMSKTGLDILRVRDETEKVIRNLNANTLFGLVQFSRSYDRFAPYLVPATRSNKEAALQWLWTKFRTNGSSGRGWTREDPNGIQSVMKAAFTLEPDVIVLISDGSFQRDHPSRSYENVPWDELGRDIQLQQGKLGRKARLHFVGFGVRDEHRKEMRSLVRRNDGKFQEY
jgi:hypothetical protein